MGVIAGVSTVTSTSHMVMPSERQQFRGGRGRGIIAGGNTPSNTDTMTRIQISTAGNSVDFGNLSTKAVVEMVLLQIHHQQEVFLIMDL